MGTRFTARVRVIVALLSIVALILTGQLYLIAIVKGDEYRLRADRQYVQPRTALYDRGSIFFTDRDGRLVSAATLDSGFLVTLNPSILADPNATYDALSRIVEIDETRFFSVTAKTSDPYEEIAHRIQENEAGQIASLDIEGVRVFRERWRSYPARESAATTIGFVAYDNDTRSGRYGLERYYDDVLSKEGAGLYVNFFAEVFANIGSAIFDTEMRSGDVITSLEPSVERTLERTLADLVFRWGAASAGGIVIDPSDGAVYALATVPSFDLNRFSEAKDPSLFSNPLVENVFEMGSIIKPLTVAAGLDANVITALTTYFDEGSITLNGATIRNFDGEGRGVVPMQEVLNQSLNTGAVFVAGRLGNDRFREYFFAYGLPDETGIDLPNESAGLVLNLESPRDLEYATASFGQGIAMTPIATVRALSTLANGGVLVTPHVGREIRYESGLSKKISYPEGRRVLSPETSEEITRMLVAVVDDALLLGTVAKKHYSIAAKTGTAQIAKEGDSGYYEDRFLHSFFGYFPAYDPRFLVFLYLLEPRGARYASQTLTHPFMDITDFLINYYEIPPDR